MKTQKLWLVGLAGLLFSGCLTLGEPAEGQTILLIPIDFVNEAMQDDPFGMRRIKVQNMETLQVTSYYLDPTDSRLLVKDLEPGAYKMFESTFIYDWSSASSGKVYSHDIRFTLESGAITLFPEIMWYKIYHNLEDHDSWIRHGFHYPSFNDLKWVYRNLAKAEDFSLWRFSSATLEDDLFARVLREEGYFASDAGDER